jgi:hypothetical protein
MTRSSTPALWASISWLVTTRNPREMISFGNELAGTRSLTKCFLSWTGPNPKSVPCWGVWRSHEIPDSKPLMATLVLVESISPRSMATPLISTKNLSPGVQLSIWYRVNSMVTRSAIMGSGPEPRGMEMVLDICSLPVPSRPRNSEKPAPSVVDPEAHSDATVEPEPSKSSSSRTTSGTQATVGPVVDVVGE